MAATPLTDLLHDLAGAVFPAVCPGCGRPAEPVCARCAAAMRAPPPAPPPPGVDAWVAPFAYDGVGPRAGGPGEVPGPSRRARVARRCDRRRARSATTRRRRRHVGSHRSRLGAAPAASITPAAWRPLVARVHDRPVRDAARARSRSAADGAGDRRAPRRSADPSPVRRPRPAVLLVDDVATTGASLRVAAAALRGAGAVTVIAATAARTP